LTLELDIFVRVVLLILAYVFSFLAGRELDQGNIGNALRNALVAIFCFLGFMFMEG